MRLIACLCLLLTAIFAEAPRPVWSSLKYRSIGPYRGGRVIAVSGVVGQRDTYYFGATGGGVWKSTDGGDTWLAVSDGFFQTGTVGSIAVSESNPNVVYVGMGEGCIRGNVSHGDGVYKSVDGGKTWKNVGLGTTRHIPRIRIHPTDPNTAWAAVLGHIFGPHEDRGVYKTTDGGKTWRKVLYKTNQAGAIDLVVDPTDPEVLYASLWDVKRTPYSMESGGPGSGLFQSTDGGETWKDLSKNEGMPKGILGRIGIAVSPVNPERVWAQVEADEGGLFRSDDGGKKWRRVNGDRNLRQRAWYYTHILADPLDADRIYAMNVQFYRSDDGGATFKQVDTPHGDNHDLWIDPKDNRRMIGGDDGGAHVSTTAGTKWTAQDQATAQFYRVTIDNEFPYNIYGAQQDNSTIRIASRSTSSGITEKDWWDVGGGESGWIAPSPKNPDVVFAGSYGGYLTRYEKRTGQTRVVNVWPDNPMGYGAEGMKYRFQWNFPILFSPHDANVLYTGGNRLFRSVNEGQSWEAISPDLTRNDATRMGPSGGPITKDNTSVEYYCTIFALAESTLAKGTLWTGSDDGLVWATRDGGKNWANVTPKEAMPEWIQINSIEASPHDAAKAYFAATMYKSDDFRPYLFRTTDGGKSWTKIVTGIPDGAFTRVIREDPGRKGLLYAGTETGVYVSFDDGGLWQPLQLNLPVTPVTDLAVHKGMKDLVVATQGRSFWVLDDLAVLHHAEQAKGEDFIFPVEDAYRMPGGRGRTRAGVSVGENPPAGAVFNVWLKEKPKGEMALEILDGSGKVIRKFVTKVEKGESEDRTPALKVEQGWNALTWNLRHEDAKTFPGLIMWAGSTRGPQAAPGRYKARLTGEGVKLEAEFQVLKDPRLTTVTAEDLEKQQALLLQIRDKLSETHEAILKIREMRKQLDDWGKREKELTEPAKAMGKKLTAVEEELYQTKNKSGQDPLNYPIKLNNKLAALGGVVGGADMRPTDQSYQLHEELTSKINAQLKTLDSLLKSDLASFNKLVRDKNVPAVGAK